MTRNRKITAALLAGTAALGCALLVTPSASAGTKHDTVTGDRATVRDYPGRLVLANATSGDDATVTGYCGDWVRVSVAAKHAMATPVGWIERAHLAKASEAGGLDGVPQRCGTGADRWRDWVSAINSPFSSVRKTTVNGKSGWRRVVFGTPVALTASADCTPSLNYTRATGGDTVDAGQRVTGLDLSKVSYRYVTTDGAVALVSAPRTGGGGGVWSFVPSSCLHPASGRKTVYYDEPVAQLGTLAGIRTGVSYDGATIRAHGCSGAVASPSHPHFGYWPDPDPAHRPVCPA